MSKPLPDLLDPWRAVDSRSDFAGRLPLSSLSRLRGHLLDTAGDVTFRLSFFCDEERRAVLHCRVAADLKLCCQRCLGALDFPVDEDLTLALVSGADEERRLPERYDPLLVGGEPLHPKDVIEDELLLALPQIPMHESASCASWTQEAKAAWDASRSASPFAVLADLKRGK